MYRSHRSKGQTSLEFIAMTVFVMLIFTGVYTMFVDRQIQSSQEQQTLLASMIANNAAFEVKMALIQGPGYTRNVTLPETVLGNPYSITIDNGALILSWTDRSVIADPVVNETTGTVQPGKNTISNEDGEIVVS